jgi:16S rRNA (cytosine1402-N4)-methyltransferase
MGMNEKGELAFQHTSVLLDETIHYLTENAPVNGVFVDGTIGGGGHAAEICAFLNNEGLLIGIDRDQEAIQAAGTRLEKYECGKILAHDNYSNIKEIIEKNGVESISGGILDLGVSSFQLDTPCRGFSYMYDSPLDMRMDTQSGELTAEYVVNSYSRENLTRIISSYGEERWASRISGFIEKRRKSGPIRTTFELVDIIKEAIPASARREGPHPAKRTFQAIRIEVNDELGTLKSSLDDWIDCLNPGARLCIISFHSLEDRIVKETFARRENPCTCPKTLPFCVCGKVADGRRVVRKPVLPDEGEQAGNPRARSAKLRVFERI